MPSALPHPSSCSGSIPAIPTPFPPDKGQELLFPWEKGFILLPGVFYPWNIHVHPCFSPCFGLEEEFGEPSMGGDSREVSIPASIPNPRFGSKSRQKHFKNPKFPPSSAVPLPGIIPTSIPTPGLTTKAGKGRQRSRNPWNQTFGSSLLSWAGASSASQLSPGSAHSDEVNQKSPGLIPAAGMAGNKSLWGPGSWIPELSVGNGSRGCAKSDFEGLLGKSVLKSVRF